MSMLGSDAHFPTGFPGLEVYYGQMAILYMDARAAASKKPVVIGHSGSDGTFAWAWPDRDLMVLYFTQSRGQSTGIRLEKDIYRLLINPDFNEDASPLSEEFKPFIGQYTANFGPYKDVKFKVLVQNESLAVDIPGSMIFELNEPDENGWRTFKLTKNVSVLFMDDDSGKVKEMKMVEVTSLPRKPAVNDDIDEGVPEECRPLLGKYTIPMANAEVTVFFQNDSLTADLPGKGKLKLKKKAGGKRWISEKDKEYEFSFDFDDSGNVTAMNVSHTFSLPRDE
jgi:hypothetical protein